MSITISIIIQENNIGLSYFDNKEKKIYCTQYNIIPKTNEDAINLLLSFQDVQLLIVPTNMNSDLLNNMKQSYLNKKGKALFVQRMINTEFYYENSLNKLLDLNYQIHNSIQTNSIINNNNLIENRNNIYQTENQLQKYDLLIQIIDIDKKCMIQSLGGLLCSLINNSKINRSFSIFNIILLKNINQRVNFNFQSLNYLNIFKDEIHPSMIKGKGRTKEGYSLFMLFSKYIYTKIGLKQLKHLFLTPIFDINILKKRNEQIEFFYSISADRIRLIKQCLSKCSNLNSIIQKLINVQMKFDDWYRLKLTLEQCLKLMFTFIGFIEENKQNNKNISFIFQEYITKNIYEKLSYLNNFLDKYLEFSISEGEITIRHGIVEELDELIQVYDNIDSILDKYTIQELQRLKNNNNQFKSQMMIQYFPQLGFFVTLEKEINLNNSQNSKQQLNNQLIQRNSQEIEENEESNQNNNTFSMREMTQQQNLMKKQTQFSQKQYGSIQFKDDISSINDISQLSLNENNNEIIESKQKYNQSSQNSKEEREQEILNDNFDNNDNFNDFDDQQSEIEYDNNELIQQYKLIDDYQFCFSLSDALLFKNDLCNELDEKYGDIQSRIIDIQRDVLREIESQVLSCNEELIQGSKFIGELDMYFCLYQCAEQYNLRKPQLTNDSVLILYEMRNILTEISVGERSYIPNNFCVYNYSNQDNIDNNIKSKTILNSSFSNRFTFLTGPNFSGKSVLLKTIGMICYLAHIGSFIPCRFSKIGMIDGIYTTFSQHDSVLKFTGETAKQLSSLNHVLYQATNKSLILIDELGKNLRLNLSLKINYSLIKCLTEDNFSINKCQMEQNIKIQESSEKKKQLLLNMKAEFEMKHEFDMKEEQDQQQDKQSNNLKQQYEKIPITLMASHLNQLFTFYDFKENYLLRFAHMEVLIDEGKNVYKISELEKDLSYQQKSVHIYKLKSGAAKQSCSVLVAKNIITKNESLIQRTFEILHSVQNGNLKLNPREILQIHHIDKVKKAIEYLKNSNQSNE